MRMQECVYVHAWLCGCVVVWLRACVRACLSVRASVRAGIHRVSCNCFVGLIAEANVRHCGRLQACKAPARTALRANMQEPVKGLHDMEQNAPCDVVLKLGLGAVDAVGAIEELTGASILLKALHAA